MIEHPSDDRVPGTSGLTVLDDVPPATDGVPDAAGGVPWEVRPEPARRRARRTLLALAAVVLGVLAANLLPLAGIVDVDPLLSRAGLVVSSEPGWLPGQYTIDPNDGFLSQAVAREAADQWLAGEVPYWNSYEGLGSPLAGGMQPAAFFLPFVLLLRLADGLLYFHVSLQVLAAVGTYLLLRRLRVGHVVAAAGGIAFGVSGTFAWLTNAVMNPIAFLPWLILGIELVLADEDDDVDELDVAGGGPVDAAGRAARWRRWTGTAVIALSLSGSLYAGFPEVAYFDALLAYAWGALRLLQRRRHLVRRIAEVAFASVVGLLVAAPILVAFLTYLPHADTGSHDGAIGNAALGLIGLPALVLPYVYGPIFGFQDHYPGLDLGVWWGNVGGYLPMAAVALLLIGVAGRRERGLKLFLVGWSLVVVAKIFGTPVVSTVVGLIPAVRLAAFYRYAPVMVELAVIVLAALAIDEIVRGEVSRRRAALGGLVALGVVAAAALAAKPHVTVLTGAPQHELWAAASVLLALGVTVVVVGAALLPARAAVVRRLLLGGALVVEAVALFVVPQLSTRRDVVVDLAPVAFLQQHLGTASFATLGPIAPNYGTYFGIRAANVNDVPVPRAYSALIETRLNRNTPPLVFTGSFMTNPGGPTNKDELLTNVRSYADIGVRYVVAGLATITPEDAQRASLSRAYTDDHVEIFELPGWKPYYEPAGGSGCRVESGDFAGAVVDCPEPAQLVRRELPLPGWSAAVDGREVEVGGRDGLFQAVPLPAGRSTVDFTFRPPLATESWVLLVVGLLALLVRLPPVWTRLGARRPAPGIDEPEGRDGDSS